MRHPSLYQINTRVLLGEIGRRIGRPATLDDVEEPFIEEIAASGFEWVWFLGAWQTGEAALAISRNSPGMREAFGRVLRDFRDEDVSGSPFAIQEYAVHKDFGGNEAMARLRDRLARNGLRLLLDFVPNHVAPDHKWVFQHPEYFIAGTEEDLAREPMNYGRFRTEQGGTRILAYGRDPYFAGWSDTLQINHRHPGLRRALKDELLRVSSQCDGVRCDMAMLVQPEIFRRTWGDKALPKDGAPPEDAPFWPEAIGEVRRRRPDFLFIAEVYWDMEWELQQAGFDFTYDKRLYDRLRDDPARSVRDHLSAAPAFRDRSLRFLENHDEPRAAAVFPPDKHRAAAVISFLAPGLRFFHEGQLEGRKIHVSMHLGRRPPENPDPALGDFYRRLLEVLKHREVHDGVWRLHAPLPAWEGNSTWDQFVCGSWELEGRRYLACVNYGPARGQCYVRVSFPRGGERMLLLADLLGEAQYLRQEGELSERGLYLDMPAWGYHVFEMAPLTAAAERSPVAA